MLQKITQMLCAVSLPLYLDNWTLFRAAATRIPERLVTRNFQGVPLSQIFNRVQDHKTCVVVMAIKLRMTNVNWKYPRWADSLVEKSKVKSALLNKKTIKNFPKDLSKLPRASKSTRVLRNFKDRFLKTRTIILTANANTMQTQVQRSNQWPKLILKITLTSDFFKVTMMTRVKYLRWWKSTTTT